MIGTLLVAGLFFLVRTNAPVDLYRAEALNYEEKQTQAIIEKLASSEFMGRETGTEGAGWRLNILQSRWKRSVCKLADLSVLYPGACCSTCPPGICSGCGNAGFQWEYSTIICISQGFC
jgi:hypothetical protein